MASYLRLLCRELSAQAGAIVVVLGLVANILVLDERFSIPWWLLLLLLSLLLNFAQYRIGKSGRGQERGIKESATPDQVQADEIQAALDDEKRRKQKLAELKKLLPDLPKPERNALRLLLHAPAHHETFKPLTKGLKRHGLIEEAYRKDEYTAVFRLPADVVPLVAELDLDERRSLLESRLKGLSSENQTSALKLFLSEEPLPKPLSVEMGKLYNGCRNLVWREDTILICEQTGPTTERFALEPLAEEVLARLVSDSEVRVARTQVEFDLRHVPAGNASGTAR